jgi:hypothetical protein
MATSDTYRCKAEALLRKAAQTLDMAARGRLIDEALHWHKLALDAHGHRDGRINDNRDGPEAAEASA